LYTGVAQYKPVFTVESFQSCLSGMDSHDECQGPKLATLRLASSLGLNDAIRNCFMCQFTQRIRDTISPSCALSAHLSKLQNCGIIARKYSVLQVFIPPYSEHSSDPCAASIRILHVIGLVERLRYLEGLEHASCLGPPHLYPGDRKRHVRALNIAVTPNIKHMSAGSTEHWKVQQHIENQLCRRELTVVTKLWRTRDKLCARSPPRAYLPARATTSHSVLRGCNNIIKHRYPAGSFANIEMHRERLKVANVTLRIPE
jgi:hypothetical protein